MCYTRPISNLLNLETCARDVGNKEVSTTALPSQYTVIRSATNWRAPAQHLAVQSGFITIAFFNQIIVCKFLPGGRDCLSLSALSESVTQRVYR